MRLNVIRTRTTSKSGNVLVLVVALSAPFALCGADETATRARELLKQSLEAGNANALRLREYATTKHVDEKQIDPDGSVRTATMKTFEPVTIEGLMIRKLVAKDGKPLPSGEARKEEERIRHIVDSRKRETPAEKERRLEDEAKKRVKQRDFNQEILDAFEFHLVGEEELRGRKTWVIDVTPAEGYRPKEFRAQIFPHVKGRIWIDQKDHLWAKADAFAFERITLGFGLIAKLEPGAHFYFEQTRTSDGVWLIRDSGLRATAHVALVKRIGIEQISTFDNIRKVPAGVELIEDSAGN